MAAPRKFDVLVDGQVVYTGLMRTAGQVFDACFKAVKLQSVFEGSALVPVLLVVHVEGGDFLHV